jgi:glycosyltransferase involved in cell wall biosynthesis
MPTSNRRAFVPHAIRYFLSQDYPKKEIVIVDDGSDRIEDIVPVHEQVRYIRLQKKMTLGEKRNFCVEQCKGDLIMHWDDDDWMAPYRISYQVQELLKHNAEVCGLKQMFFYQPITDKAWLYTYPDHAKPWLAGGSLLYTRSFWKKAPFPNLQVASDTPFILRRKMDSYVALDDTKFYVATVHEKNTSPKRTDNSLWHSVNASVIRNITGEDWTNLNNHQKTKPVELKTKDNKEKIAILITTCNRPDFLERIVSDLRKESGQYEVVFFIVDDGILRNGKKNYWKTINTLWSSVKCAEFSYYIQLPDDVELEPNFIQRSIEAWKKIDDPQKICLNLFLDGHRMGKTCWTNFWPQLYTFNSRRFLKTQWVDMFFISERKFFEQLQWAILPIPPERWVSNPELSSGVGQQISRRLHQKGLHLYQSIDKMGEHIGHFSMMNPEVRKKEPLQFTTLAPVYAGMASIPQRESQMKHAVNNVLPYVDKLYIFLNDYVKVPDWLGKYNKVITFLSNTGKANRGDAGKFYGLTKITDKDFYYFSLDDDMLYPPDYVWYMIDRIEKHKRRAVVGCGGYIMKENVTHFYTDRKDNWHISMPNREDRSVHILHTCLTAWHSSTLRFSYEHCLRANMGDIWLALAAQKEQVPMILVERPANWVHCQPLPVGQTIYGRYRNHCDEQSEVFNSWEDWQLYTINGDHKSVAESYTSEAAITG